MSYTPLRVWRYWVRPVQWNQYIIMFYNKLHTILSMPKKTFPSIVTTTKMCHIWNKITKSVESRGDILEEQACRQKTVSDQELKGKTHQAEVYVGEKSGSSCWRIKVPTLRVTFTPTTTNNPFHFWFANRIMSTNELS